MFVHAWLPGPACHGRIKGTHKPPFSPPYHTPPPHHTHHTLRFSYARGVLTNTAYDTPAGTPPGTLESPLRIERIVLLGLPGKRGYRAVLGGVTFEVAQGAVDVRRGAGSAHIVRRPDLPVGSDWSLAIEAASS